tara:strand:- start:197 stop:964 length:768 start_codon:yes stop_codon:yes gene_type:complete
MKVPSIEVGKQFQIGAGEAKCLGKGTEAIRGSGYVEGPVEIGDDEAFDDETPVATVMIGPDANTDTEEHAKRSLHVKGNVKIEGNDLTSNALNLEGDIKQTGNQQVEGSIVASTEVTASGVTLTSRKPFDIPHPTKEGQRLRHVCLEGPESAVYCRGRVCNGKNIIDLPDYWDGLVDYETMTIQLTALHSHQNVIVKRISPIERRIYLQAQGGMPVDCFYHIMAERKDGEKLIVEYEGTTSDDYPGDNSIYSINK